MTFTEQYCKPIAKKIISRFPTVDSIIAAANVLDFGADPSGEQDCADAFQAALDAVSAVGGGTVWVPSGEYRLQKSVSVPTLCTLRGEYQDPDSPDFDGDYGTVILADTPSEDRTDTGLFLLQANGGIEGLTVYYPAQDINDVKPFPYTFYLPDAPLRTIKNITLLNSYRGAGTEHHDMFMVKNLKATCLKTGIYIINGADVGVFDTLTLTPDYWAKAPARFNPPAAEAITAWCKANESAGLVILDAEQQQYNHITVRGLTYGVLFPLVPTRFMGSGPFYRFHISDCVYGIYAQEGAIPSVCGYAAAQCPLVTSIDWRCGYNLCDCYIEGEKYAIYNGCSAVKNPWGEPQKGYIRMTGCTVSGAVEGYVLISTEDVDLSEHRVEASELNHMVKSTGDYFVALGAGTDQTVIQMALDAAGAAGGGVVYLAAGRYQITRPLTVPANVELHGAAGSQGRLLNHGTSLWVCLEGSEQPLEDAPATITLDGDGAGITGIHVVYADNIMSIDLEATFRFYPYAIRGKGKGVYCVDCCINGCTHGIDFRNCDGHTIETLVTACSHKSIVVSGNGGLVMSCLHNATLMYRTNILPTREHQTMQKNFFGPIGRPTTRYIVVEESKNQKIFNCFIYGGNTFLTTCDAENVIVVNACTDSLGGNLYDCKNGQVAVMNSIRTAGGRYLNDGCRLRAYNEASLWVPSPDIIEN